MAESNSTTNAVVIKKYANRRLYDTSTSAYVTLDHLSDLVRRGVEFEVRDAKTSEDLTRSVLTQIIFERETKGEGALPLDFLRKLIGFYGGGPQALLPAWLEMSMNSFAERQERWTKAVAGTNNPFALFEKQAAANMQMFENAMRMFNPAAMPGSPLGPMAEAESFDDDSEGKGGKDEVKFNPADPMSLMQMQLSAMQAQLDAMIKK